MIARGSCAYSDGRDAAPSAPPECPRCSREMRAVPGKPGEYSCPEVDFCGTYAIRGDELTDDPGEGAGA